MMFLSRFFHRENNRAREMITGRKLFLYFIIGGADISLKETSRC